MGKEIYIPACNSADPQRAQAKASRESLAARLARLTTNGARVVLASAELAAQLAAVGLGTSKIEADKSDRRFTDPAWREHPGYRRLGQAYLAWSRSLNGLADRLETHDWRKKEQLRFALDVLTSAAAPTNTLPGNPEALVKAFNTGGASLLRGTKNWLHDVRHNRGMPSQVDASGFKAGENLAVTPRLFAPAGKAGYTTRSLGGNFGPNGAPGANGSGN